jgi:hypothetical protein
VPGRSPGGHKNEEGTPEIGSLVRIEAEPGYADQAQGTVTWCVFRRSAAVCEVFDTLRRRAGAHGAPSGTGRDCAEEGGAQMPVPTSVISEADGLGVKTPG